MEDCPFCGLSIAVALLPDHCAAHLADEAYYEKQSASLCPDCSLLIPADELGSHLAAHRVQEKQLSPADATGSIRIADALQAQESARERREFARLQAQYGLTDKREGKCFHCKEPGHWARDCPQNNEVKRQKERVVEPARDVILVAQQPATCLDMQQDIVRLLRTCLLDQRSPKGYSALLAGPTNHYQSDSGDTGWGCGWRNIQMLLSHILKNKPDLKAELFGGKGFVPDIASLQAWLECAWKEGFDEQGAEQLGHSVQASHKWIGTTECAALLRYWGVRAQIVDFKSGEAANQRAEGRVGRRLDGSEIHHGVTCDKCSQMPLIGPRFKSQVMPDYDLCAKCLHQVGNSALAPFQRVVTQETEKKVCKGRDSSRFHEQLASWVWDYFMTADTAGNAEKAPRIVLGQAVRITGKGPLYFQHEGHSRTIIGCERTPVENGQYDYTLLVLDPSTSSKELLRTLQSRAKWQPLLKRGVHTLRASEYQLLYVEDGLASPAEREVLKMIVRKQLLAY